LHSTFDFLPASPRATRLRCDTRSITVIVVLHPRRLARRGRDRPLRKGPNLRRTAVYCMVGVEYPRHGPHGPRGQERMHTRHHRCNTRVDFSRRAAGRDRKVKAIDEATSDETRGPHHARLGLASASWSLQHNKAFGQRQCQHYLLRRARRALDSIYGDMPEQTPGDPIAGLLSRGRERDLPGSQAVHPVPLPRSRTPAESTSPRLFVGLVDAAPASRTAKASACQLFRGSITRRR
jgi:hypothetical protein